MVFTSTVLRLKLKELTDFNRYSGTTQKETPTFNTTETNANGDKISIAPSAEYPAKLVNPANSLTPERPCALVAGEGLKCPS